MIRILAVALAITVLMLGIAVKVALSYHEELSKSSVMVTELSSAVSQAKEALVLKEQSCKITDSIVEEVVGENAALKESTDSLLDELAKLEKTQPSKKRDTDDKAIYIERLDPALLSLLRASYCDTSGDTDYCSPSKPSN